MANPIPGLPLEMAALQNVKKLNLDSEMMESPPTEVASKGWQQTQAYLNQLTQSLKTGILRIDDMALRRFPAPVCLMTELTELSMRDNNIKVVPEAVGKLQSLTSLNLTGNQLSTLPASVSKLMLLKELLVSRNPIRTLPPELGTLTALKVLTLDPDVLESPPRDILAKGSVAKILQYLQLLVSARSTLKLPFNDFECSPSAT
jgi:Leucine-rich repeat (LRR) protein